MCWTWVAVMAQLAFSLARSGAQVTGIDVKEENIRLARQRYQHAALVFIQGDVRDGLPNGPFDVIVLSNVLEHLGGRSGIPATAR